MTAFTWFSVAEGETRILLCSRVGGAICFWAAGKEKKRGEKAGEMSNVTGSVPRQVRVAETCGVGGIKPRVTHNHHKQEGFKSVMAKLGRSELMREETNE